MKRINFIFSLIMSTFLIIFPLAACDMLGSKKETHQKTTLAETVFEVTLAQTINENDKLYVEMVDEVTGIALNPIRYEMEAKDSLSYFARVPLAIGSLVKYRYVRDGSANMIEHDTSGNTIRYRLHEVRNPVVVHDLITGWDANAYAGTTGEISGYIYDAKTEAPLSEIMVFINGLQTFTSSDGFYEIKNVPLGEYNLVALHPNGDYHVFQQGAVIAENSVTPASFGMKAAEMVEITFVVSVPEDTISGAPLRLLGNTYLLGNTFSELKGGTSVLSSQSPLLAYEDSGKYTLTLELPEGLDFRYKYTLGDGFINAEHNEDGSFGTRQFIVPAKSMTVYNTVKTWYSSGNAPITFSLTVPQNTPENDVVSIQFNPFVWMEPISMWETGTNHWAFTLYSPLEYLDNTQFRFCRNYQCGLADDVLTAGSNANGYILDLSESTGGTVQYSLENWAGLTNIGYSFQPIPIPTTNNIYIRAVEFSDDFNNRSMAALEWGLVDAAVSGVNMVILSPTWTFNTSSSNQIGLKTGNDLLFDDLTVINLASQEAGISLALYPQPGFLTNSSDYWYGSTLDYSWWQEWFTKYERFILNYADYAEVNGITTLIIGGNQVAPAFPNGKLPDGNSSNVPYDFSDKWSALIDSIRSRFHGQLFFSLPHSSSTENLPGFISKADAVYVEFSTAITATNAPTLDEMKSSFSQILDSEVYKLYATYQKPIILGIDYSSLDGSASNCLNTGSICKEHLNSLNSAFASVDVEEQAQIYQAIIEEAIQRNWIYGLVSKGYDPTVAIQDNSGSIHGKSSMNVLAHYFNSLIR